MASNIVLIGFMGSGKSTIAGELAGLLDTFALDTDSIIQNSTNLKISEIFAKYGEKAFRAHESHLIHWLSLNVSNAIIATGGGMPIFNDVRPMGKIVYLCIGFEEITKRLTPKERAKRPLFGDKAKALELFHTRESIYKKTADIIINASKSPQEVCDEILHSFKPQIR
ncbi:shikimate kinase [Helicobacter fennelliae]|nr:shikimate kinase [Helicobacter fennelliae]SQB99597.1 shikimate kinase [Helicobacter fennelliae]STP07279.1 shikimate kinase [Helicobacter fennelliae]STQ85137.1 shikimate kinase [Helicobacter fennelliae]